MKRVLAIAGLVLALGLGYASAQNITRSLQGSQDPRGPVGWDTSNALYFPGHLNAFGQMTTPPSASNLATNCVGATNGGATTNILGAGSTDVAGQITTRNSSCSITFGSQYNSAPACVISPITLPTTATSWAVTTATTGFNLVQVISGAVYSYICLGNQ